MLSFKEVKTEEEIEDTEDEHEEDPLETSSKLNLKNESILSTCSSHIKQESSILSTSSSHIKQVIIYISQPTIGLQVRGAPARIFA